MAEVDLSIWPAIATSGGRMTMVDGGKYRQQKLAIHRDTDGQLLVVGSILIDDKPVAEKQAKATAANVESIAKSVAVDLGLDQFTLDTCITSYRRAAE